MILPPATWAWIAGGAFVGGLLGGFLVARGIYVPQIAQEAAKRAQDASTTAQERVTAAQKAMEGAEAAWTVLEGRIRLVDRSLATATSRLASQDAQLQSVLAEVSNDPRLSCRKLPLPEPLLDLMRRPGETGSPAPGREGSATAPGTGAMLPDSTRDPPARSE